MLKVAEEQGVAVTGPPFGFYPRPPAATVAVAAGFPVARSRAPSGDVDVLELPGGRAVQAVHVGPFDTLERTYHELLAWVSAQGLELAEHTWETYLSDPAAEPDPTHWQTLITWPLR